MEIFSVFVTGANRGIGLGLVQHLVQLPKPPKFIFATYRSRDAVQALKEIKETFKSTTQVLLIKMDVTRKNEIEAARKITEDMVGDRGLTLLINNAGVGADQRFPHITEENVLYHFKTNTVGPVMIFQEFLPLLEKAAAVRGSDPKMDVNRAAVLNISSILGSNIRMFDCPDALDCPGYSMSKAALNMAMRVIAASVKDKGILVVMMCPGWVKTDMGTENAEIDVHESVSAILSTLPQLNESHHGSFMDRHGRPYEF